MPDKKMIYHARIIGSISALGRWRELAHVRSIDTERRMIGTGIWECFSRRQGWLPVQLFLSFFLSTDCWGADQMPSEIGNADRLGFSTVRIQCLTNIGQNSTGTGFFFIYTINGHQVHVVVTNKHVVKDAKPGTLFLTEANADGTPLIGKIRPLTLDAFESRWIPHPDATVDLCILPIGGILNEMAAKGIWLLSADSTQASYLMQSVWRKWPHWNL